MVLLFATVPLFQLLERRAGEGQYGGGELFHREDDREEIILHRFEVYEKQTYPILERYENRGKVKKMDGEIKIEEISDEVERILGPP